VVTFPASKWHCPFTSMNLYCLVAGAQRDKKQSLHSQASTGSQTHKLLIMRTAKKTVHQKGRMQTFNFRLWQCPVFDIIVTCTDSSVVNGMTLSVSHQFEKHFQHHDRTWRFREPTQKDTRKWRVELWVEVGTDQYETNVSYLQSFTQSLTYLFNDCIPDLYLLIIITCS